MNEFQCSTNLRTVFVFLVQHSLFVLISLHVAQQGNIVCANKQKLTIL